MSHIRYLGVLGYILILSRSRENKNRFYFAGPAFVLAFSLYVLALAMDRDIYLAIL